MNRDRRILCCLLLAIAAVLACFYLPYLANTGTFYVFDIFAGWHPTLTYLGNRLRDGQLPLWNPFILNGIPQVADIAPTFFYPLHALFAVFDFNPAFALLLMTQQLLAAAGAFALVSSFGWGPWAAALAAVSMSLCGLTFSLQPTPTLLGTTAWFLITWWAIRRIDAPNAVKTLTRTAVCGIYTFLLITAGVIEVFGPGLLFLGLFSVTDYLCAGKFRRRRAAWILVLRLSAMLIGVLLAGLVLVPAAEWSRLSPRSLGLPLHEIFSWSCSWYDFLCMLSIQPLGDLYIPTNAYRPLVATSANHTPYLGGAYLGPILISLAGWGLFDRRFRWRWLCLAVLVVSLILSAGSNVPFLIFLAKSLKLRVFRYPVKAMVFACVALIILAARGMFVLVSTTKTSGNRFIWCYWIAALAVAVTLQTVGSHVGSIDTWWHLSPLQYKLIWRCGIALLLSAAIGLACALLFDLRKIGGRWQPAAALILLCGTAVLFSVDAWRFNRHVGPSNYYTRLPLVVDQIRHLTVPEGALRRVAVLYENPHPPAAALDNGSDIDIIYQYSKDMMAPQTNVPYGIDDVSDFSVGQTADHSILWRTAREQFTDHGNSIPMGVLTQMTGTKLIVDELGKIAKTGTVGERHQPPNSTYFDDAYINPNFNLGIYRTKDPLARAFFAKSAKWGSPHESVLEYVARPDESKFDPHKLVILERENNQPTAPIISGSEQELEQSEVAFAVDRPEYIKLNCATKAANFLILNDQYYPGWRATMDGTNTTIYRANVIARAVYVPAGKHIVEFRYRPDSLTIGLVLHALGWLGIIKLLVLALLVRRYD